MLRQDPEHSAQCWLLAIPKSFAPTPPKFSLGLFVRLSDCYQKTPQVTYYGKIISISWFEEFQEWSYSLESPWFHLCHNDLESLWESDLEERLIEDGWLIEQQTGQVLNCGVRTDERPC